MEEIFLRHGAIRSKANRLRGNTEWTEQPRVGNYSCRACHTLCHNRPTNHAAPVTPSQLPQAHTKSRRFVHDTKYGTRSTSIFPNGRWALGQPPAANSRAETETPRLHPSSSKSWISCSRHVTVVPRPIARWSVKERLEDHGNHGMLHKLHIAHQVLYKNKPNELIAHRHRHRNGNPPVHPRSSSLLALARREYLERDISHQ
jgi:hypothetical protein